MTDDRILIADKRHGADRAHAFIDAWRAVIDAGKPAPLEIRLGEAVDGGAALLISLGGLEHVMTTREARILAEIVDNAIKRFPAQAADMAFAEMRDTIIDAANAADAELSNTGTTTQ